MLRFNANIGVAVARFIALESMVPINAIVDAFIFVFTL